MNTDIIFSINVHEKREFLIKQINNIKNYVSLNYIIIINTNTYMYNKLLNCPFIKSQKNIILNNEYFDKQRFHGSLTKGIFLNMKLAIDNYKFKYFMILSSRNMFYNKLNNENYHLLDKTNKDNLNCDNHEGPQYIQTLPKNKWHWPSFLQTKLSKYIIKNNMIFTGCCHEGLTFDYKSCQEIIKFSSNNEKIMVEIFNWDRCVEEFALQTICINMTGYYYHIGQWDLFIESHEDIDKHINKLPKNKYIFKTTRI